MIFFTSAMTSGPMPSPARIRMEGLATGRSFGFRVAVGLAKAGLRVKAQGLETGAKPVKHPPDARGMSQRQRGRQQALPPADQYRGATTLPMPTRPDRPRARSARPAARQEWRKALCPRPDRPV